MTARYHPKYRVEVDRKGWRIRVRVPLRECPVCKPKCAACGWPFRFSTAIDPLDELLFCSQACAKRGIEY